MSGTITRAGLVISLVAFVAACEQQGMGMSSAPMDDPSAETVTDEIATPTDGAENEQMN